MLDWYYLVLIPSIVDLSRPVWFYFRPQESEDKELAVKVWWSEVRP